MIALMILAAAAADPARVPDAVAAGLKNILAVGREGTGNEAAAEGWKAVTSAGPAALIPALTAFDTADATAANWLRTAADGIAGDAKRAGQPLDPKTLLAFAADQGRSPAARRIAFELGRERDAAAADALLLTFIHDKSLDLRRDAIAARLKSAKDAAEYTTLFEASRDPDQAEEVAKLLRKAGQPADLTRHYGLITEWQIIGPFPSVGGKGFGEVYPPEKKFDPALTGEGHGGIKTKVVAVQAATPDADVNLNETVGKVQDVVGYAYAVVVSPAAQAAEVRVSSPNAVQIFLNGERIFSREAYHAGSPRDGHVGRGTLKAGRNELLIKVAQNNMSPPWAKAWNFSARVCDATGGKLNVTQVVPGPGGETSVPLGRLKPAAKPAPETKGEN